MGMKVHLAQFSKVEKSNPICILSKDINSPTYARISLLLLQILTKGLGLSAIAIELNRYICDALILKDKGTYTVLLESEAMAETKRVHLEIKDGLR